MGHRTMHFNDADCLMCKSVLSLPVALYTVDHKKRDILFLNITLANRNRF